MATHLILLVLLAALLHALWNSLAKAGPNPLFSVSAYKLASSLLCLLILPWVGMPAIESWPAIIASVLIHTVYYFSLANAYRFGDLSQVYPLFRGLAPILVALGGFLFAGESLTTPQLIGIVLISLGLMSLSFLSRHFGAISSQALMWGMLTSLMIAGYTIVDGLGVRVSNNPLAYIAWLFVLEIVPVGGWLLLTQRRAWQAYLLSAPGKIVFGGITSALAYGLVIYALGQGAMALVSSLRETSVIFAAIIGSLILKEPFGKQRLLAAIVVAVGVVIIRAI